MDHYLLIIDRNDPNPHCGDAREWFLHDKWNVEGETFYPVRENWRHAFKDIQTGDRLWIAFEDRMYKFALNLIGYVDVLRQQEDYPNNYLEIWYDGEKCHDLREERCMMSRGGLVHGLLANPSPIWLGLKGDLKDA